MSGQYISRTNVLYSNVQFNLETLDAGQRSTKVYMAEKSMINTTQLITSEKCKAISVPQFMDQINKPNEKVNNKFKIFKASSSLSEATNKTVSIQPICRNTRTM